MGISTHVLDTSRGRPAADVPIELCRHEGGEWAKLSEGRTDADGRVKALLPDGQPLTAGTYRVRFATGDYLASKGDVAFYPEVYVSFVVSDPAMHHHIPLLLNPYGYSTYRGS